LIITSTRVTIDSTTLNDNIFTNAPGIWVADISNHFPVFTVLPSNATKCKTKKTICKQNFSAKNLNTFKNSLRACDWTALHDCQDANSMYNTFIRPSTTQTV